MMTRSHSERPTRFPNDGLRIGDFIAVISGRTITLHRIIRIGWESFKVRASPKPIRIDRKTFRERGAKGWRKAYKPTEYQLNIIRSELQTEALTKEAKHLSDQIATVIRKASHLPSEQKLATLRSVILYSNRLLKRTNALLPSCEHDEKRTEHHSPTGTAR